MNHGLLMTLVCCGLEIINLQYCKAGLQTLVSQGFAVSYILDTKNDRDRSFRAQQFHQ